MADYHARQRYDELSTPPPRHKPVEDALAAHEELLASPPLTPSKALQVSSELARQLRKSQARTVLLSERLKEIREAQQHNQTDRRRPKGTSRMYDINTLKQMQRERDEKQQQLVLRRLNARGRQRLRGRQGRGRCQQLGPPRGVTTQLLSSAEEVVESGDESSDPSEATDASNKDESDKENLSRTAAVSLQRARKEPESEGWRARKRRCLRPRVNPDNVSDAVMAQLDHELELYGT